MEVAKLGVAKLEVDELEDTRQEKLVQHTVGSADSVCSVDTVDVLNSGEKKYEMLAGALLLKLDPNVGFSTQNFFQPFTNETRKGRLKA